MKKSEYVHYGCGPYCAPRGWNNFDASPTLRLQSLPAIGRLIAPRMHVTFAPGIQRGDIRDGLPGIGPDSCIGVYCSHVLEHLSYKDCLLALTNTYRILKPGGRFRLVVPDLEWAAREYVRAVDRNDPSANRQFLKATRLGQIARPRGLKSRVIAAFGNSEHLFMWDVISLTQALKIAGFTQVRPCSFNDSEDPMFHLVEEESRFQKAVALEAVK
jgi:hypothetical protein